MLAFMSQHWLQKLLMIPCLLQHSKAQLLETDSTRGRKINNPSFSSLNTTDWLTPETGLNFCNIAAQVTCVYHFLQDLSPIFLDNNPAKCEFFNYPNSECKAMVQKVVDITWSGGLDTYNLYSECAGGISQKVRKHYRNPSGFLLKNRSVTNLVPHIF